MEKERERLKTQTDALEEANEEIDMLKQKLNQKDIDYDNLSNEMNNLKLSLGALTDSL